MKFLLCILGLIAVASCKMVDEAKVKECATKHKITDTAIIQKMMTPGFSTTNKDEKVSLIGSTDRFRFFNDLNLVLWIVHRSRQWLFNT